jgi:hypothetical protein
MTPVSLIVFKVPASSAAGTGALSKKAATATAERIRTMVSWGARVGNTVARGVLFFRV